MKNDKLMKLFLVFLVYFIYTMYASTLFGMFGISDNILASFIGDIIFSIFVIYTYRKNLKSDLKKIKKLSSKKLFLTILKWVALVFVFVMFCGFITEIIFPNQSIDANNDAIYNLYSISTWYTIFKTMIFGTIIEEILYRESVRDNVKNKFMFIIISAVVYTFMNTIFVGFTEGSVVSALLMKFLPGIFWSIAYLKNSDNILLLSMIKFTYNLIPLTILLLGL
ncbi:MAG: hypothetical protein J6B98_05610 [Bacilli bacterium]|nr:hypothetical protein [Bacilli bacterium]